MKIEYAWGKSLALYLKYKLQEQIESLDYGEVYYKDGFLDVDGSKIDISDFKFKDELRASNIDFVLDLFGIEWDLFECVDDCAKLLCSVTGKFGWFVKSYIYLESGNVKYSDFLPNIGSNNWKVSKVPRKVTSLLKSLYGELSYLFEDASFSLYGFQYVPLLRLYMSDKGLSLGVWDDENGSDDYYGVVPFSEMSGYNNVSDLESYVQDTVLEVLKLGKPVRDVFILTNGSCDRMYYRKNDDGEYTITIY